MKISTRTRYGIRLMFELALYYDQGPVQLNSVAKREGISEKYLSQIIIPLRTAGLVTSVRGTQGGYLLTKRPEEITALDVAEALEGGLDPVPCLSKAHCSRAGECASRDMWSDMAKAIRGLLGSYTLSRLVDEYKKTSVAPIIYEI